ncbi:hypothetical protein [Nonomuraea sp. NPDC049400]|uniref:hypothetical protein n=1 Tax=Nonomuraea sp. NPDC049400 TaxID=3364352 RepID=UPI0037B83174
MTIIDLIPWGVLLAVAVSVVELLARFMVACATSALPPIAAWGDLTDLSVAGARSR